MSSARHLPEVDSFSEVREAEVVRVNLGTRAPTRAVVTHTVQRAVPLGLTGVATPAPSEHQVAVIPNGRLVTHGGAVVDEHGRLVLESLWDREHWRRAFDPPPSLPPARLEGGRHASIVSLWSENFYHWMFEALPRLAILQRSGVEFDKLIVPDRPKPFHYETLELAGIPAERVLPLSGGHLQVDELIWVSPLAPVGYPTTETIEWLRATLGPADPPEFPSARYYLARGGDRRLVNEPSVMRQLRPFGFETIDPGQLTVREQIALFTDARYLVGPHGAAFSNAIFSRRLGALELFQRSHLNISTIAALSAAGHDHWSLVCRRRPRPSRPSHFHAVAPIADLRATLARLGL